MFRQELTNLTDVRHALVRLAQMIDWSSCEERFGGQYAAGLDKRGHPIRLIVGLQLLNHVSI